MGSRALVFIRGWKAFAHLVDFAIVWIRHLTPALHEPSGNACVSLGAATGGETPLELAAEDGFATGRRFMVASRMTSWALGESEGAIQSGGQERGSASRSTSPPSRSLRQSWRNRFGSQTRAP